MDIRKSLAQGILLFDGAMGTMLQNKGLPVGELPELYNLSHPHILKEIHSEYVKAGSQIISANTFQANRLKIPENYSIKEIITAGISLAKASNAPFVALDIGPLGQMLKPLGTLSLERAYDLFAEQMIIGEKAEADCIVIETFSDLLEAKIAILAAKENTDLPIFCTMTFQEDGRTFMGCDPLTVVTTLEGLGIEALGLNCSLGPKELLPIVDEMLKYSRIPIMVQANAGLPSIINGKTEYNISSSEFAKHIAIMLEKGVKIVGGCCGTTPDFISELSTIIPSIKKQHLPYRPTTRISSGIHTVIFDNNATVIGERINPTGKPKLSNAIRNNQIDYILTEAINQSDAGSDVLDVNLGLPDINEPEVLPSMIMEIQAVTNLPLQIDSSSSKAIEAAARVYNGKPLINSVNGKQSSMDSIFPIVKKYGAAVVCLTLDDTGIPPTAHGRLAIAEKILIESQKYDIPKENLIIDCLALTVSAQQDQAMETIKAISLVKKKLGLHTVLGVSNISFGLPNRPLINSTFLAACFGAGMDAAILNPLSTQYMSVVDSYRVLNNQDAGSVNFIQKYSGEAEDNTKAINSELTLTESILKGRKEETSSKVRAMLKDGATPLDIIDNGFTPALNEIGDRFERKIAFLPQLLQSAEAVKAGFLVIKEHVDSSGIKTQSKGKIIVATVEGDIHDIGKNIVAMILENYGYDVIDLGKDVPVQDVLDRVKKDGAPLLGLSALMTTTVQNMKLTIEEIRKAKIPCTIMVGGAVLNEEYSALVGADYYAKDAMDAVAIAKKVFQSI